jgi:dolichol kinase
MRLELTPQTRAKLNLASAVLFGVSAIVWAKVHFAVAVTCLLFCAAYAIAYRRDSRKTVPVPTPDRRESITAKAASVTTARVAPASEAVWKQEAPRLFLVSDNTRKN